MIGVSALASAALLLVSGVAAQQECSSIYNAIQTHNTQMAAANPSQSITTFTALLDALGFTEQIITQLGSSSVLVPNDQAFATFVEEAVGANADPVSFIMTQPDAFKQILLFHFGGPLKGSSGELHTGIESAIPALEPWINPAAICGREDSKFIHIKYTSDADDGAHKFTEPIGKHFMSNELDMPCETEAVSMVIVDRVLTPCPLSTIFSGCMTVAAAAAEIPEHPFGTVPYTVDDDTSIVSLLKHPNVLTAGSGSTYTVFVPTTDALSTSGVTGESFTAIPGALEHVVAGHVVAEEICLGGGPPANGEFATKLDGTMEFCGEGGAVTVATGGQGAVTVTSATGASATLSGAKNIAVCGGVAHIVNDVLLPCEIAAYTTSEAETETSVAGDAGERGTPEAGNATPGTTVEPVADSSVGVATGVLAAVVALAAVIAM